MPHASSPAVGPPLVADQFLRVLLTRQSVSPKRLMAPGPTLDEVTTMMKAADHLRKFWDPRMRKAIIDYVEGGGGGLQPRVLKAVEALRSQSRDTALAR